jgi:divalent metal cation (Fe/Co/Zn/Cd) transporter
MKSSTHKLYRYALALAVFTVLYNFLEGLVSVFFGIEDETLTLLGFGVDSFIEVMSGVGIIAMVLRIQRFPDTPRSTFERSALQITGASFYILSIGLAISAVINIMSGKKPETTLAGIIISTISIVVMWALVAAKRKVGRALDSAPILADANCTLVCFYMSAILLISSLVYELSGFGFIDALGAVGLIFFSIREGNESFGKAKDLDDCACETDIL